MARTKKQQQIRDMQMWDALALVHGYNALAKQAPTFGEKTLCYLGLQHAEKRVEKLGGKITYDAAQTATITLDRRLPPIRLTPQNIELMRKAVKEYDEHNGG